MPPAACRNSANAKQFCADTGYSLDDQPEVMDDRDNWQEGESGG